MRKKIITIIGLTSLVLSGSLSAAANAATAKTALSRMDELTFQETDKQEETESTKLTTYLNISSAGLQTQTKSSEPVPPKAESTGTKEHQDSRLQPRAHISQPNNKFGGRAKHQINDKLATFLNMTPADFTAALKSGKSFVQIAAEQGITEEQLNQFLAAQQQTKIDNLTKRLAAEVASGKITQAQMDKRLTKIASNHSNKVNNFGHQALGKAEQPKPSNAPVKP